MRGLVAGARAVGTAVRLGVHRVIASAAKALAAVLRSVLQLLLGSSAHEWNGAAWSHRGSSINGEAADDKAAGVLYGDVRVERSTAGDGSGLTYPPGAPAPQSWSEHPTNERHLFAVWLPTSP